MDATIQFEQGKNAVSKRLDPPEDLSRRLGGLIVIEYLMNLFGDSPKELFGRLDVLAVLDGVKKDRALFPDAVVAMSDRIDAAGRTRCWKGPKSLDGPARRKRLT
jgi:hypothetical protein